MNTPKSAICTSKIKGRALIVDSLNSVWTSPKSLASAAMSSQNRPLNKDRLAERQPVPTHTFIKWINGDTYDVVDIKSMLNYQIGDKLKPDKTYSFKWGGGVSDAVVKALGNIIQIRYIIWIILFIFIHRK